MDPVRSRIIPWLLGFFLTANTFLVPTLATSPRATDLLGVVLAGWLLVEAHRRGVPSGPLAALGVAIVMPVVWLGHGILEGHTETVSQAGRWLVAAPWAVALLLVTADVDARARFAWGLVSGCGVGVLVVVLQFLGYDPWLRMIGFSTTDSAFHHYVYHQVRIPGMHGHHSASSAVLSLIGPASLYLYFRRGAPLWLPIVCLLAMMLALNLTSTRSPLVVAILVVGLGLLLARDWTRLVPLGGLLVAGAVLYLAIFGPPGGAVRWTDMLALEANAGERLASNATALEISVRHPLGMGVVGGKKEMVDVGQIEATHNALLQASLFFGAPLALMLLAALLRHTVRFVREVTDLTFLRGLLSLQILGLFMFEEHLNNPTFVILGSWLLAAAVMRDGFVRADDPAPTRVDVS
ncbi:hypothetical protein GF314_14590 [bacterium]|nr:hypothetical protein [bacterium]